MPLFRTILISTAIAAPTAARAQLADSPAALTAAVRAAVDRGELLYVYDRAAWQGTDDLRARYPALLTQIGGHVISGDEATTELVFYDKSKAKAVYRARFTNTKLTASGPAGADRVPLTMLERQLIQAKDKGAEAFARAKVGTCGSGKPNLAVLPSTAPGGAVTVYLTTPQTDPKSFPLGGHYSVEVRPDGSTGEVRRFTNACIDMSRSVLPKDAGPAVFFITHLLDPTPTEIHVFTSLASEMPIGVMTGPSRVWLVDGNRVESMSLPKAR
jgi:hypothetical protein